MAAAFIPPPQWHASLAGVVAVAGALITDAGGAVLIVKQNYRDGWVLPGGICEFGEPPHEGARREVAEEVGIDRPAGRLLAVDWHPAFPEYGTGARPSVYFVFDGGTVARDTPITLQQEELDAYQFAAAAELPGLLLPRVLRRTEAAMVARDSGATAYLPQDPA
jgi:8-oxo-dGTP diphosphatase